MIRYNMCLRTRDTSGVAQKYGYISKMIFHRFNGYVRGYKRTKICVQHHESRTR